MMAHVALSQVLWTSVLGALKGAPVGFDPQCGRSQELGTCPGYSSCLLRMTNVSERLFLQQRRRRFTVPVSSLPEPHRCTRANCVDLVRCVPPFRMFVYNVSRLAASGVDQTVLDCLGRDEPWDETSASYMTDEPSSACAFWVTAHRKRRKCETLKKLTALPHWGADGTNHMIFETTDIGISSAMRTRFLGHAMLAQGVSLVDNFIHGMDVAVPIRAPTRVWQTSARFARSLPWERKWLLTFKGTASHGVRSRLALYHDEQKRVAILVYPIHHHCSSLGKPVHVRPELSATMLVRTDMAANEICCARMLSLHQSYDYDDLLNSTFGLIMPGRSPASYRLSEVLAAGAIPVFVGMEHAVLPFAEVVRWSEFALSAPSDVDIRRALLPKLRELLGDRERLARMQAIVRKVSANYFMPTRGRPPYEHVKRTVVEILRRRFEFEQSFRRRR